MESACVFEAVQDAPGLRIRPRKSCDLMEVGRMARMRRFRATSSGHRLITDASLLCAQRIGLEPIVFRRQVRIRVLARDCSAERPLPADVRTAQLGQLCVRAAAHAGCVCAASGQFGQRTAVAAWISRAGATVPRCLCAPFGTSTVAPPDKLHVVLLEPHSRLTKASRDAGLVFLNTNLTRKGCT